jgi:hypothetical protein
MNQADDGQGLRLTPHHAAPVRSAGRRGPSLLEDFILREPIQHFGHECIPERVVHTGGLGAHGLGKPVEAGRVGSKREISSATPGAREVQVTVPCARPARSCVGLPTFCHLCKMV